VVCHLFECQGLLYPLQVNTFKDGMLGRNDHAGAGLMLTRMAEVRPPGRGGGV
jgi:hypothetical protein